MERTRRRDNFPKTEKALLSHLQQGLLQGNQKEVHSLVNHCLGQGWKMMRLYRLLFIPVLHRIGELWHLGEINVAQEHLATNIIKEEMNFVREATTPTRQLDQKAVVSSVEGSLHSIGGRMMADFLLVDGWQVDFLGANVPKDDLLSFIKSRSFDLVVLTVSMREQFPTATETINEIKSLKQAPSVMLGGPFGELKKEFPAIDLFSNDLIEGLEQIRQKFHLDNTERMQTDYLQNLGRRIAKQRKHKQWSQQQLAEVAKLDRTYISGAERGKQNLTIGAIAKIADALGMDLEDLLVPR